MHGYGLYQTLSFNIPKRDLSLTQKKELVKRISTLGKKQCEALLLLICEHARSSGDFDIQTLEIPYTGKQEGGNVVFDFSKFPVSLRWVTWRFIQVVFKEGA